MFENDSDQTLLARLVWGEARGEDIEGKIAVACVVRNRVKKPRWWGKTYRTVMLRKWQFSTFNENDPNLPKLLDIDFGTLQGRICQWVAKGVIEDVLLDTTKGSTHYHVIGVRVSWAPKMIKTIELGNHVFYRVKK